MYYKHYLCLYVKLPINKRLVISTIRQTFASSILFFGCYIDRVTKMGSCDRNDFFCCSYVGNVQGRSSQPIDRADWKQKRKRCRTFDSESALFVYFFGKISSFRVFLLFLGLAIFKPTACSVLLCVPRPNTVSTRANTANLSKNQFQKSVVYFITFWQQQK